jgi:hypothetical protein
MAAPMSTSMDFKEWLQFPIKPIVICIVIHIKYRDTYRLWKKCIVTPLVQTQVKLNAPKVRGGIIYLTTLKIVKRVKIVNIRLIYLV